MKRRGFEIFTRPYELNIVGLRNRNVRNADEIHVFYKINSRNWNYHVYEAITDSATIWQGKAPYPLRPVLLAEGQYKGAYKLGKHKNTDALVEVKPVTVVRDLDRSSLMSAGTKTSELFGIDILAATEEGETISLDIQDEGCQLLLGDENFKEFLGYCGKHKELYGNEFSYSLIDFRTSRRKMIRTGFAIAASILSSFLFGFLMQDKKDKRQK